MTMLTKKPQYPALKHGYADQWVSNFIEDWLSPHLSSAFSDCAAMPKINFSEDDDNYYLDADVPGVTKDCISLTYENDILVLSAERRSKKEESGRNYHKFETYAGTAQRRIAIPSPVDKGKISATHKDGVLHVTLPKFKGQLGSSSDKIQIN